MRYIVYANDRALMMTTNLERAMQAVQGLSSQGHRAWLIETAAQGEDR